ncbi:MAG: chorismate synthase [Nitrospirae bacterium]|nr:chorismate synthase [Nitrospirota bacterium]
MLRFLTAGESHGKALVGIIEKIPSGMALSSEDIDDELKRRQLGYGRGGRMKIEQDRAQILSGVRWGKTIGSPIALLIENRDWMNWQEGMSSESVHEGSLAPVTKPRPGHADLGGALKYNHKDVRNVLERSSARETAMKVALGAIARKFLSFFSVHIGSCVTQIGTAAMPETMLNELRSRLAVPDFLKKIDASPVRCPDADTAGNMTALIDKAQQNGDSLGGRFEVVAAGIPAGLGSHIQWDRRLNGMLSQAFMGIQAIKGVEIGDGFACSDKFGSQVMDEIFYRDPEPDNKQQPSEGGIGFYRLTNHAGGIEGGITNGMPVVVRAVMKPIPTLKKPLHSIDLITKESLKAAYERSDTCAVPAAAVIGEAMAALVIADAFLEKFGGDSLDETKRNYDAYIDYLKKF